MRVSAIGISRAYFSASTGGCTPAYAMSAVEHDDHCKGKGVLLLKQMCGTRAAADGCQQEYSSFLKSIGFQQGADSPCVFIRASEGTATSVHHDDFTSAALKCELDLLETKLKAEYELR